METSRRRGRNQGTVAAGTARTGSRWWQQAQGQTEDGNAGRFPVQPVTLLGWDRAHSDRTAPSTEKVLPGGKVGGTRQRLATAHGPSLRLVLSQTGPGTVRWAVRKGRCGRGRCRFRDSVTEGPGAAAGSPEAASEGRT